MPSTTVRKWKWLKNFKTKKERETTWYNNIQCQMTSEHRLEICSSKKKKKGRKIANRNFFCSSYFICIIQRISHHFVWDCKKKTEINWKETGLFYHTYFNSCSCVSSTHILPHANSHKIIMIRNTMKNLKCENERFSVSILFYRKWTTTTTNVWNILFGWFIVCTNKRHAIVWSKHSIRLFFFYLVITHDDKVIV